MMNHIIVDIIETVNANQLPNVKTKIKTKIKIKNKTSLKNIMFFYFFINGTRY